jgi:hypothetical protein
MDMGKVQKVQNVAGIVMTDLTYLINITQIYEWSCQNLIMKWQKDKDMSQAIVSLTHEKDKEDFCAKELKLKTK